ncbi:MAG: NADH-quinone oxidoreductase subunit NuoF [Actinobacteria bacterium]|nr:NADH-quinone oxidoreductase subunit NuoF [Actinomycetota bacterium]
MDRVVTANFGRPESWTIASYQQAGGYHALARVLRELQPEDVIQIVKDAGLTGRGGAFFPTGMKWELVRKDPKAPRYVVVNGDESEPGTYVNRYSLELDPHLMLEGMIIAAYASAATRGYVYIRGEFGLAHQRVRRALAECYAAGFLGQNILGRSDFSFEVSFRRGAGAYICGEETALFNSLEGKRGNPRFKPPFPTNVGVWGKPTAINNVETLSCVPAILTRGAEWFKSLGRSGASGTKMYCLSGHIERPGVYELPLGTTARELIFGHGGGVRGGRALKAFKPGGASSAPLTPAELDAPLEPKSMGALGTIMGTGGVIVMDDTTNMVEAAYHDALFFEEESCGFCIPCREGTPNLVQILERIMVGQGAMDDLDLLEELGASMMASFCGLGQFAHQPVRGAVRRFRDDFVTAIAQGGIPKYRGRGGDGQAA